MLRLPIPCPGASSSSLCSTGASLSSPWRTGGFWVHIKTRRGTVLQEYSPHARRRQGPTGKAPPTRLPGTRRLRAAERRPSSWRDRLPAQASRLVPRSGGLAAGPCHRPRATACARRRARMSMRVRCAAPCLALHLGRPFDPGALTAPADAMAVPFPPAPPAGSRGDTSRSRWNLSTRCARRRPRRLLRLPVRSCRECHHRAQPGRRDQSVPTASAATAACALVVTMPTRSPTISAAHLYRSVTPSNSRIG